MCCRALRLTRQVTDVRNAEDISYTHSGYAPMSVRLIEQLIVKQGNCCYGVVLWNS